MELYLSDEKTINNCEKFNLFSQINRAIGIGNSNLQIELIRRLKLIMNDEEFSVYCITYIEDSAKRHNLEMVRLMFDERFVRALDFPQTSLTRYNPDPIFLLYHKIPKSLYIKNLAIREWIPVNSFWRKHHTDYIFDSLYKIPVSLVEIIREYSYPSNEDMYEIVDLISHGS